MFDETHPHQSFGEDASASEARTASEVLEEHGLNYTVALSSGGRELHDGSYKSVPWEFIYREDTGAETGVAKPGYELFQNHSGFNFLNLFIQRYGAEWGVCGEHSHGTGIFLSVNLPDSITVRRNDGTPDVIGKSIVGTLSHTGSGGVGFALWAKRAFCDNQYALVMKKSDERICRFTHSKNIENRVEEAQALFFKQISYFDEYREMAQGLALEPFTSDDFVRFGAKLLHGDDAKTIEKLGKRARKNTEAKIADLLGLFEHGKGNTGDSKWDALNAVTEYVDHKKEVGKRAATAALKAQAKADDVLSGDGYRLKRRAVRLLTR